MHILCVFTCIRVCVCVCMVKGLSDVLHRVVEEVRLAISRDVSGAELLHNLLSAPWLHALLKVLQLL